MIPYFIAIAHPDYKRPSTQIITKTCEKDLLRETLLSEIVDIYVDTLDSLERFSSLSEIEDSYYCDYYMDQTPVSAQYYDLETNNWEKFVFSDEEFFQLYKELYLSNGSEDSDYKKLNTISQF